MNLQENIKRILKEESSSNKVNDPVEETNSPTGNGVDVIFDKTLATLKLINLPVRSTTSLGENSISSNGTLGTLIDSTTILIPFIQTNSLYTLVEVLALVK